MMKNKGITLIALVITIIVLLILAGVSVATLTGDNGLLVKTNDAKEKKEIGQKREAVIMALGESIVDALGDRNKVTIEQVTNHVKEDEKNNAITYQSSEGANTNGFPANIIFPAHTTTIGKDILIEVDENLEVKGDTTTEGGNSGEIDEDVYSVVNVEPSPQELFIYEVIDSETARILGMNPKYCNSAGYSNEEEYYEDTYYKINYNENQVMDLIVPYEVEINGKMYTVTEVSLGVHIDDKDSYSNIPYVDRIVYPNTVKKMFVPAKYEYVYVDNNVNRNNKTQLILSKKLEEVGACVFTGLGSNGITLPDGLKKIGDRAFAGSEIISISIPESVTSIGEYAFNSCDYLEKIYMNRDYNTILGAPWGSYSANIIWNDYYQPNS